MTYSEWRYRKKKRWWRSGIIAPGPIDCLANNAKLSHLSHLDTECIVTTPFINLSSLIALDNETSDVAYGVVSLPS